MPLYNKKTTYSVIGGLLFLHVLCFGLSMFFIYKFMFLTYDPAVFVLLIIIIGSVMLVDLVSNRTQAISRFFLRCTLNKDGIICRGPGFKAWNIRWDEICFYGISGFTLPYRMGIIFLSKNPKEVFNKDKFAELTNQRIVFEACDETFDKLRIYMPTEMQDRLLVSMKSQKDCCFRR